MSPDTLSALHKEMRLLHIYNSNAIEGNTLTLSETKLVLEEGVTVGGKSLKEHLEAKNTAEAYDLVRSMAEGKRKVTPETILEIHEVVTHGILVDAGRYRTANVRITGAVNSPPAFLKVPSLVAELAARVQDSKDDVVTTAAKLHHGLVEIHPFADGNGRVARLMTNLYLMSRGYLPIALRKKDRMRYYEALRKADAGNVAPFIDFIARAIDESLTFYLSAAGGRDELIPVSELAEGTGYSAEYISLLARRGRMDAVKINNKWHSSKKSLEHYLASRMK